MRRNFASKTPKEVQKASNFDELSKLFEYFHHKRNSFESVFDAFDAFDSQFQNWFASRFSRPRPRRTRVETNRVLGLLWRLVKRQILQISVLRFQGALIRYPKRIENVFEYVFFFVRNILFELFPFKISSF